ncbi:hypothetical protein CFC21_100076, partial [Triticum aestivum]|jgi:hypothetical protein
MEE